MVPIGLSACSAQGFGGFGGFWDGYRPSTAGESYARGLADVIRSQGSYNLDTSEANINQEEARKKYLENRERAQQIYFDMRRRNDAYRAEKRGPTVTSEQLFRINAQRAPNRLTNDQLDPVSGELNWPLILTAKIYAPYREVIDAGFEERALKGSHGSYEEHRTIVNAVDELYEALKSNIREYDPPAYIDANRFMEALAYDVKFPTS